MNALGLSERTLVQRTQLPYFQFRQARKTSQFDSHITLGELHRLASQLGLTIQELLAPPPTGSDEPLHQPPDNEDVQVLIPLLVDAPKLVSIAHAARTLDWSRERMEVALDAIPAALDGTGLRLHRINGTAKISAVRMADRSVRHAFGRIQTTAAGLNLSQARLLQRIADGDTVFHRNIGNQEKLTLGALKNMGCVELDADAQYRPTADLRLALPDL